MRYRISPPPKIVQQVTPLEEELATALKAVIVEWRKQTALAREIGGSLAVNEGNGKAFRMANAALFNYQEKASKAGV